MVAQERAGKWTASLRGSAVGHDPREFDCRRGSTAGEKVIAVGAQLLKDGEPIEVIP